MPLSSTLLTLLLSEATAVDPTPLVLVLLDALVVIPFLWVKGGELGRTDPPEYHAIGNALRCFALLNAAYVLRLVLG